MTHEHQVYDVCEACLGQGVTVGTRIAVEAGKRVMRFGSHPCTRCEGLGFLRETEHIEIVEDNEEQQQPGDWPTD